MNLYTTMARTSNNCISAIKQMEETFMALYQSQSSAITLLKRSIDSTSDVEARKQLATYCLQLIADRNRLLSTGLVRTDKL